MNSTFEEIPNITGAYHETARLLEELIKKETCDFYDIIVKPTQVITR